MKQHYGKYAGNAEVDIDMVTKEVSFNYPETSVNENLAYFTNNFYLTFGLFYGYFFVIVFTSTIKLIILEWIKGLPPIVVSIFVFIFFSLVIFGSMVLFGYISLLIHKFSPNARKAFSKTNAIFSRIKKERKIDCSKNFGRWHYIHDKTLVLFRYSIVYFDFLYEGKNKLLRFKTKSVEKEKHKGMHFKFIAFFEFEKPLTEGVLRYK